MRRGVSPVDLGQEHSKQREQLSVETVSQGLFEDDKAGVAGAEGVRRVGCRW